jgi:hypothetical protein
MNVGILKAEGNYDYEKFLDFVYYTKNKILMANEQILLLKDKTKIIHLPPSDEDKINVINNFQLSPTTIHYLSDIITNSENFLMLSSFCKEFDEIIAQIKLKNILHYGLGNSKLQSKIIEKSPEYIEIEKKKILIVFKIFKSFSKYFINSIDSKIKYNNFDKNGKFITIEKNVKIKNKNNSSVLDDKDLKHLKSIDYDEKENIKLNFDVLKINEAKDYKIQIIILESLLLFLLGILNKSLTYRIWKNALKVNSDDFFAINNLKNILDNKIIFQAGLYYDLILNLRKLIEINSKNLNLTYSSECNKYLKDLELNSIFENINCLTDKHFEHLQIYINVNSPFPSIFSRRNFVKSNLKRFLEENLDIFENILRVTQNVHDFLIMKKMPKNLMTFASHSYRTFLELRNVFFEAMDNISGGILLNGLSERDLYNYEAIKMNYDCYFLNASRKNKHSLLHKNRVKDEELKRIAKIFPRKKERKENYSENNSLSINKSKLEKLTKSLEVNPKSIIEEKNMNLKNLKFSLKNLCEKNKKSFLQEKGFYMTELLQKANNVEHTNLITENKVYIDTSPYSDALTSRSPKNINNEHQPINIKKKNNMKELKNSHQIDINQETECHLPDIVLSNSHLNSNNEVLFKIRTKNKFLNTNKSMSRNYIKSVPKLSFTIGRNTSISGVNSISSSILLITPLNFTEK